MYAPTPNVGVVPARWMIAGSSDNNGLNPTGRPQAQLSASQLV